MAKRRKPKAVPAELQSAANLAAQCQTAEEFATRLAAGEAIRIGEWVRDDMLPVCGLVTGEDVWPGVKAPVWNVRLNPRDNGKEIHDVVFKAHAVHVHGLHDPRAFFLWLIDSN